MNLQPRQSPAAARPLLLALALSAALHLLLFWPSLQQAPEAGRARVQLALARTAPAAVQTPLRATEAVTGPTVARRVAPAGQSAAVSAAPAAVVAAEPPVPGEGALRALRYALARGVATLEADAAWPATSMSVQLHLLARRVVAVELARSSGHEQVDAAVLAAFKAAAARAVIPDSLPAHGFTVELELEAGDASRSDDAAAHLPG